MAYSKQNFRDGDFLHAYQLNAMDSQIKSNEAAISSTVRTNSYASERSAGIIRIKSNSGIEVSNDGLLQVQVLNKDEYASSSNDSFISKGTLEAKLAEYQPLKEEEEEIGPVTQGFSKMALMRLKTILENAVFKDNQANNIAAFFREFEIEEEPPLEEVTDINISQTSLQINGATSVQLTATTVPAGYRVSWSSSNMNIAMVDDNGLVTAIANGNAVITARYGDIGKTCSVSVTGITQPVVTYTITNNLTNVSTSNSTSLVEKDSSYSATLTSTTGEAIETVTITMGGTNITSTAYRNGIITISKITGNVVIEATAPEASSEPEPPISEVVPFNDNVAKSIATNLLSADVGDDLSTTKASTLKSFGNAFLNSAITNADWVSYFTGLTDTNNLFKGCNSLTSVNIRNWRATLTSGLYMTGLFSDCTNLQTAYISGLTSEDRMNDVFARCSNLISIELDDIGFAKGQRLSTTFYVCPKLRNVKISFKELTSKIWYFGQVFTNDAALEVIEFDKLDLSARAASGYSAKGDENFKGCSSLRSIILNNSNTTTLTEIQNMLVADEVASNVTITFDGANYTYNGAEWRRS